VGDDLNITAEGVRQALGPKTLAVIAPHMYGCPAPIEALEALCRDAKVFLVDDAAQVVGERVAGRLLGTFGDVGVISFAQSKAIVTGIRGSGGVLLVNRPEWHDQAVRDCNQLPASGARLRPLLDFLWNYIGAGYTGSSGYYFSRLRAALGVAVTPPAGPARISNLEAAIAVVQLGRWPTMRSDQLRLLHRYHESLVCLDGLTFPQYHAGRYLARVVVLVPVSVAGPRVRHRLSKLGIETRASYPPVPEGSELDGSELSNRVIGLPISADLKPSDVDAICRALQAVVMSCA
jgi:dTDP-4-amino-4,6-dideoxygalactose transaminase